MNISSITVRYAKALFQASQEENILKEVESDILAIDELFKESEEFKAFVYSPTLKISQKTAIAKTIFDGKVQLLTINFIVLLIQNKREAILKDICRYFNDLYKKYKGVKSATLITSQEIDADKKEDYHKVISKLFDSKIELNTIVKEDIVGGFKLKIEDQLIDASISSQLNKIKTELINS